VFIADVELNIREPQPRLVATSVLRRRCHLDPPPVRTVEDGRNANRLRPIEASIDKPSLGEDEVSLRLVGSNASAVARREMGVVLER
jgi:hypothetical protein